MSETPQQVGGSGAEVRPAAVPQEGAYDRLMAAELEPHKRSLLYAERQKLQQGAYREVAEVLLVRKRRLMVGAGISAILAAVLELKFFALWLLGYAVVEDVSVKRAGEALARIDAEIGELDCESARS